MQVVVSHKCYNKMLRTRRKVFIALTNAHILPSIIPPFSLYVPYMLKRVLATISTPVRYEAVCPSAERYCAARCSSPPI